MAVVCGFRPSSPAARSAAARRSSRRSSDRSVARRDRATAWRRSDRRTVGLARLIHGLGDVVGKRRTCQQAKRRQQPNHRNRAEDTGPCHDRPRPPADSRPSIYHRAPKFPAVPIDVTRRPHRFVHGSVKTSPACCPPRWNGLLSASKPPGGNMTASSISLYALIAASAFALASRSVLRRRQPEPDGGQAEGGKRSAEEPPRRPPRKRRNRKRKTRNPSSSSSTATSPRMR